MEDGSAPLPRLTGEGENAHRGRHRWMLASFAGVAGWVLTWTVLIIGIQTGLLDKPQTWLILTILGFVAVTGLAAFPVFLAGLLQIHTKQGKIITVVSGLHALTILLLTIAIVSNAK